MFLMGRCVDSFRIGLEAIHQLTKMGRYKLRVELSDWNDTNAYAEYSEFVVGKEQDGYRLDVSGYSGTAGNSLQYHSGARFSTFDHDHDTCTSKNCAEQQHSAWWFKCCEECHLNGPYKRPPNHVHVGDSDEQIIQWHGFKGYQYSLKSAVMKIMQN